MSKITTKKRYCFSFLQRALIYTSRFTPKEGLIKLHKPGKFPEDIICSCHFRACQKLA